jgi:hypothetical protein
MGKEGERQWFRIVTSSGVSISDFETADSCSTKMLQLLQYEVYGLTDV